MMLKQIKMSTSRKLDDFTNTSGSGQDFGNAP